MSDEPKQWWQTLPAIIAGLGTLLTAITGLLIALNQLGVFKHPEKEGAPSTISSQQTLTPSSAATSGAGSKVDEFVGHWKNENPDSGAITRVEIDARVNQLIVHMWAKCYPTDCDWGTQSVPLSDTDKGVVQVRWNASFRVTQQEIRPLADKRLEVVGHTHFTDKSGRPDFDRVNYFVRP
jgi:hypothetical protein